jgi:hypothetical protein
MAKGGPENVSSFGIYYSLYSYSDCMKGEGKCINLCGIQEYRLVVYYDYSRVISR